MDTVLADMLVRSMQPHFPTKTRGRNNKQYSFKNDRQYNSEARKPNINPAEAKNIFCKSILMLFLHCSMKKNAYDKSSLFSVYNCISIS